MVRFGLTRLVNLRPSFVVFVVVVVVVVDDDNDDDNVLTKLSEAQRQSTDGNAISFLP
jgi:hypothetical protein